MESAAMGTDWIKCFCKSGELLFYYNKVTTEHRWPNNFETGAPINGCPLLCVGTQTEYGCRNHCRSVCIGSNKLRNLQEDKIMESSAMGNDWMKFFCKSGELLFYYNKVTAEHRWPYTVHNVESGTVYGWSRHSVGSQTEDYGCGNGCGSVYVDGDMIHSNTVAASNLESVCINPSSSVISQNHGIKETSQSGIKLPALEKSVNAAKEVDIVIHGMVEITRDFTGHINTQQSDSLITEIVSDGSRTIIEKCEKESESSTCTVSQNEEQHVKTHQTISLIPGKQHRCKTCGKSYERKSNLFRHKLTHIGIKPHQCKICSKAFIQSCGLKGHIDAVHYGLKPYKCKTCGKSFAHKTTLYYHKSIHHGVKKYQCKTCGNSLSSAKSLYRHKAVHTGVKKYQCKTCGKKFTQGQGLKGHINAVHCGLKLYECKTCGNSYGYKSSLNEHELIHTGEKPHECQICGKKYSRRSGLRRHKVIHTGVKPYHCNICGKSFSYDSCLHRHELAHTSSEEHQCKICFKVFTQSRNVQTHINAVHYRLKPFQCKTCGKSYGYKSSLSSHKSIHKDEAAGRKSFECEICGKSLSCSKSLRRHKLIHRRFK